MMRRGLALVLMIWLLGFVWFIFALPQPLEGEKTDAVVVPTGGKGRIARGLEVLDTGLAEKMLITGVDPEVKPGELAAEYDVAMAQMDCCVTLGFAAVDTHTNALETAAWIAQHDVKSLRLVTTDWHMARASGELDSALPDEVTLIEDSVSSEPSLSTMFLEYNKLIISTLSRMWPG
ncbi:YdcF family protein [Altererythrobacter sp. ZODW24]|uniref:YdcF family protein n=1 Tax=Altererythrobacter sp. ZODW24 TaxID=2185142 RepID=UPI000DF7FDF7|nr:YdcF family protein [Altererythrobacter sp. ZODW24]